MQNSKVAPFSLFLGSVLSIGIIVLGQTYLNTSPGGNWFFKPFLWVFVPITLAALIVGVFVTVIITTRNATIDTSTAIGTITGLYTCYAFIFDKVNVWNVILSVLISFILYGFFSYVLAAIFGAIKYKNRS
jgi:phosphate/sulfate permease